MSWDGIDSVVGKRGLFMCRIASLFLLERLKTPEIIDEIHEVILEERRISAKSKLGNRASHVSWLGPSFMKIWTCGSSPRSGPRNA